MAKSLTTLLICKYFTVRGRPASSSRFRGTSTVDRMKLPARVEAPIKLPVWHREEHFPIAAQYVAAIRKVSEHHRQLLG